MRYFNFIGHIYKNYLMVNGDSYDWVFPVKWEVLILIFNAFMSDW